MKLALVIPGFQSSPDDWCIPVFTNLARELSQKVELHVFTLRYPARRDRYDIGAVHVHAIGAGAIAGKRIPTLSLLNLWKDFSLEIAREHRKSPFSAIMGVWATESGWLAMQAARRLRLSSLVHIAGGELTYVPQIRYGNHKRGLAGRLVTSTIARADLLTVPSKPIRRSLENSHRVLPSRLCDWAPGVDTAKFSPATNSLRTREPFQFVTAGSLIPIKGHDLVIRALALVREQSPELDVRLRIIGDGPLRPLLSQLVTQLGLKGYVTFEGEIRHERLPQAFRASDAFLLGSWHEAQCMAALEAMSCGLPWVAPPVGAVWDVRRQMGDKPSGVPFCDRNPVSTAAAMTQLLELTQAEFTEYGRRARTTIMENYSLDVQTGKLLELLKGLTDYK